MPQIPQGKAFSFFGPAVYRIVVFGSIDIGASGCLRGMRIDATRDGSNRSLTTLQGRLTDQAHLASVLNAIYEMHLTVLEVRKLDDEYRTRAEG
jgi:hypothetical protein